jgi:alpha-aminoadipate carrier protein LysW
MKTVKCPDCNADLIVTEDTEKGEIVSCPECGLELEITQISGDKLEIKELVIEGEDWGE